MQLATMHPIQISMHPLGIRKISKTNMLISALKTARLPTGSSCCLCWSPEVETAQYARCFVQCYRVHYVTRPLIVRSWQGRFLPLCIHNIYTLYMYSRALCTYINVSTHVHPEQKPLHPLCSWSGYGPDRRLSSVWLETVLSVCIKNKNTITGPPFL